MAESPFASVLWIIQNSQQKTIARVSFSNFIKKENPTHAFSCEFGKIFKNSFFTEHLRESAIAYETKSIIRQGKNEKNYIFWAEKSIFIRLFWNKDVALLGLKVYSTSKKNLFWICLIPSRFYFVKKSKIIVYLFHGY